MEMLRVMLIVLCSLVLSPIVWVYDYFFGISNEEVKKWCVQALQDGPLTPVELKWKIEFLSAGAIDLTTGKMYRAILTLKEEGKIVGEDYATVYKYRLV